MRGLLCVINVSQRTNRNLVVALTPIHYLIKYTNPGLLYTMALHSCIKYILIDAVPKGGGVESDHTQIKL